VRLGAKLWAGFSNIGAPAPVQGTVLQIVETVAVPQPSGSVMICEAWSGCRPALR
jgi:hypothetical protein